jgi:hypothetical protein
VEEIIQLIVKTYGLAGVFLLLPLGMCILLWRDGKDLRKQLQTNYDDAARKIQTCNDRIIEAHKLRVQDSQAVSSQLILMVNEQTELNKDSVLALDKLGDRLVLPPHTGK